MHNLITTQSTELSATGDQGNLIAPMYLSTLGTESSRRTMRHALNTIAHLLGVEVRSRDSDEHGKDEDVSFQFVSWHELRYKHVTAIKTMLLEIKIKTADGKEKALSPSTINKRLSALRGVLKTAWKLGYMDAESYHRASDVENVKAETLPAGRHVKTGEIAALLSTCGSNVAGIKDAAIIATLYVAGPRRQELVNLNIDDFDPETGELHIIGGKGRKDRIVWLANGALEAMRDWLAVRGDKPGPLFPPTHKGGKVFVDRRMTPQAVYNMLTRRAENAGIKGLSPHDFRRTMIGDMLDAGADLAIVSQIAGHSDVNTTARYDRRPDEKKKAAAAKLSVPYTRRNGSNDSKV